MGTSATKETINFIFTEEVETSMPGLMVEIRYSALAEFTGDEVEILPDLAISVNGDRWTDYITPSGKTNDERMFLAKLREAARLAKWQRDNMELQDNSFAAAMGRKQ